MRKFRLKRDRFEHEAGTVVYDCHKCDYGCSGDDTRHTGIEHTKVTLDPNGDYPFFTVPVHDLELLADGELPATTPATSSPARTTLTPEQLASNALHEAVSYIQNQLGVTAGDFAGMFFSDDACEKPVLDILTDYARKEMRSFESGSEVV